MADLSKPIESMRDEAEEWRRKAKEILVECELKAEAANTINQMADRLDLLADKVERFCPDRKDEE